MMRELLVKSFVVPFYKAFMGFFILIVIVFGVLIEGKQHLLIAKDLVGKPVSLLLLLLIFSAYSAFHLFFQIQLLRRPKYLVFHQMGLYGRRSLLKSTFLIWTYDHVLLIFYSLFLTIYGVLDEIFWFIPVLGVFLTLLFTIHFLVIEKKLKSTYPDKNPAQLPIQRKNPLQIKYAYWFFMHLVKERPILFLATKLISLLLLNLFFYSYHTGIYDTRWLLFGVACSSFVNFFIWKEKSDFGFQRLTYFLNMPISVSKKSMDHFYSILQVLLPELLSLIFRSGRLVDFVDNIGLLAFLIALNSALYAIIKLTPRHRDLGRNTILTFFLIFFLILYGVPVPIMIIAGILLFLFHINKQYQT